MPMDKSLYPPNWDDIALQIKTAANYKCQECQRSCRKPGETVSEFVCRIQAARTIESLMVSDAFS